MDCTYYCTYMNTTAYKPGYVTCRDKGKLRAQHFFYSVPQGQDDVPEICKLLYKMASEKAINN